MAHHIIIFEIFTIMRPSVAELPLKMTEGY